MYYKVVVAVDFSDETSKVLEKALALVDGQTEKLVLVHVVEPIPVVWGMDSYAMDPTELQQRVVDHSAGMLAEMGAGQGIDKSDLYTVLGSPATEIRNLAERQEADAIVIGSHGHSGWKLMLGSTANKLLHGATCDVLTVHVGED